MPKKTTKGNNNPKKNKHLTLEDRLEIEDCLLHEMNFKSIAARICKDPTTVSYEVKKHRFEQRNTRTSKDEPCPQLLSAPYVCNGCRKKHFCSYVHFYYRAAKAQDAYRLLLSESREGTPLNKEEFYRNDRIISEGIRAGQHIYHILANSDISCSKSSVYRYFAKGYLSASVLDLPRAVHFKPRKGRIGPFVPKGVKIGRTYEDFLIFISENHLERHTELDTVIGRPGGKVILTIHFTSCNFMAGLLLDNKSAMEAASRFSALKNHIRSQGFVIPTLFDVFLTDNGGEFADVFSFENDPEGNKEISLFFCDPMRSSQKPFIEKNHTLLRDILPKGSSFDDLTQDSLNLVFSHVNSVSRSIYGGKTPYDMMSFIYGDTVPSLFGISKIAPSMVVQSPSLLNGVADLKKNL